jgi:hypothetical protein
MLLLAPITALVVLGCCMTLRLKRLDTVPRYNFG